MSPTGRAQRLRQIAEEIRCLPEAFKQWGIGEIATRAGGLLDEAIGLGAFAGPEYARLRVLIARQKDWQKDQDPDWSRPTDWQTGAWDEAVTCLAPKLEADRGFGAWEGACGSIADLIDAEAAKLEAPNGGPVEKVARTKKSTAKGKAREKIIAALTLHHKYKNGSCLNSEPVGVNELARQAEVAESSVSDFFMREFKADEVPTGHQKYKVVCRDAGRLAESLKVLNGESSPHELYGRNPPGEGGRDEDK